MADALADAVLEMTRAMDALRLELPPEVLDDLVARWDAVVHAMAERMRWYYGLSVTTSTGKWVWP